MLTCNMPTVIENSYKIFTGKSHSKIISWKLGRQEDIIRMDTRMKGLHSLILMVVAVQYRVQWLDSVKLAMNFLVP